MKLRTILGAATAICFLAGATVASAKGESSGQKAQKKGQAQIPHCTHKIGTVAIVEPDDQWWRQYNLGSPEAVIKVFVQESGCFSIVNRGRSMQSRAMERALADNGELQDNSNIGKGQVKAADYFLQPDIVTSNAHSGGGGLGAVAGGLLGHGLLGGIAGNVSINKKEASVTLSLVNARTTEEEALIQGYARKSDVSFGGGGGGGWWGGFAAAGATGYSDTDIGQVIVLAYLDAYTKLVNQFGGLPDDPSAAAPQAK
uniref:CsgG/HfaB family protein n=1 Tax=Altererythrobacter segetis TaxID=1104773 RepID=UPI00140D4F53|nr:CsgG/HfaB family protein [Altererythrobacter segetis]